MSIDAGSVATKIPWSKLAVNPVSRYLGTSKYAVAVVVASGGATAFAMLRLLLKDSIAGLPPPVKLTDPEVPVFVVDNPNIKHNYRQKLTLRQCLVSAFSVHNESFNIYSHALAAGFFFAAALRRVWRWSLTDRGMASSPSDQSLYLMGPLIAGTVTYSMSTIAHTFCAHSEAAHAWLFAFDKASIAYILGSNVLACGMMRFNKNSSVRRTFAAAAWATTIACSAIVGVAPATFPKAVASSCFIALVALSEYPIISQVLRSYAAGHPQFAGHLLSGTIRTQLILAIGLLTWGLHFPEAYFTTERWRFLDIVGHGHTIMHMTSWWATWLGYRLLKRWNRYLAKVAQGTAQ